MKNIIVVIPFLYGWEGQDTVLVGREENAIARQGFVSFLIVLLNGSNKLMFMCAVREVIEHASGKHFYWNWSKKQLWKWRIETRAKGAQLAGQKGVAWGREEAGEGDQRKKLIDPAVLPCGYWSFHAFFWSELVFGGFQGKIFKLTLAQLEKTTKKNKKGKMILFLF